MQRWTAPFGWVMACRPGLPCTSEAVWTSRMSAALSRGRASRHPYAAEVGSTAERRGAGEGQVDALALAGRLWGRPVDRRRLIGQ